MKEYTPVRTETTKEEAQKFAVQCYVRRIATERGLQDPYILGFLSITVATSIPSLYTYHEAVAALAQPSMNFQPCEISTGIRQAEEAYHSELLHLFLDTIKSRTGEANFQPKLYREAVIKTFGSQRLFQPVSEDTLSLRHPVQALRTLLAPIHTQ